MCHRCMEFCVVDDTELMSKTYKKHGCGHHGCGRYRYHSLNNRWFPDYTTRNTSIRCQEVFFGNLQNRIRPHDGRGVSREPRQLQFSARHANGEAVHTRNHAAVLAPNVLRVGIPLVLQDLWAGNQPSLECLPVRVEKVVEDGTPSVHLGTSA